jgi:MFS family permease
MQQVLGYSPIETGLAFLPMTLLIVVGSAVASRAVIRTGAKPLLLAGMSAITVGLLLFKGVSVDGSYASVMLVPSVLVAIGIGLSFVPATLLAVSGVEPSEAGLASGLVNTSRLVGGALGLAILAAIATAHTDHLLNVGTSTSAALTSGFRLAFVVAAGLALAGGLVALLGLPGLNRRGEPRPLAAAESSY